MSILIGINQPRGTRQIGTPQIGTLQIGTIQKGTLQTGTLQIGILQIGIPQTGTIQKGTIQKGTLQIGTPQIGTCHVDTCQSGKIQIYIPQIYIAQIHLFRHLILFKRQEVMATNRIFIYVYIDYVLRIIKTFKAIRPRVELLFKTGLNRLFFLSPRSQQFIQMFLRNTRKRCVKFL